MGKKKNTEEVLKPEHEEKLKEEMIFKILASGGPLAEALEEGIVKAGNEAEIENLKEETRDLTTEQKAKLKMLMEKEFTQDVERLLSDSIGWWRQKATQGWSDDPLFVAKMQKHTGHKLDIEHMHNLQKVLGPGMPREDQANIPSDTKKAEQPTAGAKKKKRKLDSNELYRIGLAKERHMFPWHFEKGKRIEGVEWPDDERIKIGELTK